MTKQLHLAAHFPGVNNTTVWSDPAAGSHIEFDSFRQFAQTAERGKFDFLFLAEGLRLREQNGLIYDLDVVGRPDTFTILAALAAVTEHVGLTGTINSTFNEPYEVARQFASLDHLSGGRAAWNVVTSWDAFTGENFRRGGFLAQGDRYERARTFLATAIELWDSWRGDEILAGKDSGQLLATPAPGTFRHRDAFFDIAGQFNVPRSPQGRPVIFQAGDSDEGRDFAAASADAIFSRYSTLEAGQAFYADVKGRLPKFGRSRGELLILPAATFVLGDTDAEAAEIARDVRRAQVSPQTALMFIEQLWNTELPGFDVDGPLPCFDPVVSDTLISKGRASVRQFAKDPVALAGEWRARAEAGNLSAREVVIEVTGRQSFIGPAETIATAINDLVQADAADGYILVPHITPGGLAPFVDQVVPLLQERGVFRADYAEQVGDVLALIAGTYRSPEGEEAHVVPGEGAALQVWILGSSGGESAEVAGRNGLRFAANYHVSPATVLEAADGYRAAFRPSAVLDRPYVSVSADVVAGRTEAAARELATGYGLWVRSIRTAEGAIQFPAPEQARRHVWSDADRELVADRIDTQFVGTPGQVADQLERLRDATEADELIITTITHDHADRVRSYQLLAEEWARR